MDKKTIIVYEGMDGVGKTTCFNNYKDRFAGNKRTMYIHFPTEGSDAYKVLKHEKKATNKELQRMMLANILEVCRAFYMHPDYDTMVCDRFIFSNYLYNIGESMTDFIERFASMWSHFDDYSKWEVDGVYGIHEYFDIKTQMVYCGEEERIERIFSRPSQDSTETKAFQNNLKKRFDEITADKACCDFFKLPTPENYIDTSTK